MATETVLLLIILGRLALITHELRHLLAHLGCDADTGAVEPVGADVAANIELGSVVLGLTDTVESVLLDASWSLLIIILILSALASLLGLGTDVTRRQIIERTLQT